MKKRVRIPEWAERAMQGLAFWVGHRHALYRHYPLSEGALVGESCNLIHANLRNGEALLCEVEYARLLPGGKKADPLQGRQRADLVVVRGMAPDRLDQDDSIARHVAAVAEVKRCSAPTALILADLRRLAALKAASPNVRVFLFLVSEGKRPAKFVTEKGRALRTRKSIPGSTAEYRVRRACKATSSFTKTARAHYACIIEVVLRRRVPRARRTSDR